MHPQSPPLTIGGTVLKESDDLVIVGVTFDSKTKIIRFRNKDKPWFDDQLRHTFSLKQEAHLLWTHDRSRD